jgi:hypothetical protein
LEEKQNHDFQQMDTRQDNKGTPQNKEKAIPPQPKVTFKAAFGWPLGQTRKLALTP